MRSLGSDLLLVLKRGKKTGEAFGRKKRTEGVLKRGLDTGRGIGGESAMEGALENRRVGTLAKRKGKSDVGGNGKAFSVENRGGNGELRG